MSSPTQKSVPTKLAPYSAHFEDEDTSDETLVINWKEPQDDQSSISREERFLIGDGGKCLLDTVNDINKVPFEQLEACIRMGSLLAGTGSEGILLGTSEFNDIWVSQDTKHLQSIIGTAKVHSVESHEGLTPNPEGLVYDVTFKRGTGLDRKTITTDVKTVSDYKQGLSRYYFGAMCIPGFIKKNFPTYNKSNINESKRQDIINAVSAQKFWI